ncbi:hypothetical protein [Nitratireductor indicus]|uniref:hypothetical protein n=1 Tax=Nitratireductor indicus TaxID=721133 RepID=UPI002874421E|nr:hypothetical protein [Nitratireductor indicus]MDS1138580.1 hypothetical protein [Nitratireductor indicus]
MPSATAYQTNFSAGALSPRLYGRVDIAKYMNGCHTLENFITQRFGGIRKRGGTQFINEVKTSAKKTRLIPFVFSVTQAYVLEFGDLYIRIYTNGGIVESGGSPVEVTSPYGENDLFEIQFAQSADVLYLVHPDYAPRKFTRTSATTFTLDEVEFEDGPYLEANTTDTTLTPSDTGNAVPKMTSNTAPSPYVVSSTSGDVNAYVAFARTINGRTSISGTSAGYIKIDLGSGNAKVVDGYAVTSPDNSAQHGDYPTQFSFEGSNDDTNWVTIDSRDAQTGWAGSETRFYEAPNKTAFRYYRLRCSGGGGSDGVDTTIGGLWLHQSADDQTPFDVTASSVNGINDGQGFLSTDVGRHIRILGSDGRWRWLKITSYTSSTVVKAVLYGQALPNTSSILNWRMGAWSDETGWPASIGFYNSRLCFARTAAQPQTVWMTVVDDQTNFDVNSPLQDDDAITVTIASDSLNEIKWIAEATDLFVGTTAAIRTIGPTSGSAAFSPTNLQQRRETNYGASEVQPVRVGTTALYSGYYRKDVREISYSFDFNGYVSQSLSILAEHITEKGIKQLSYAQDPDSVVWGVDDLGNLFGMTYERDQEVVAFHTHPIGGSNVTVESVTTIPGTGYDEVWLVVKREVNSSDVRYIERISVGLTDLEAKEDATFLDCHLNYSGSSTTTLSGLDHLEGENVYVWGTGGKQGPYVVSSGSITLGAAVTVACVGLPYSSVMETLSPEAAAQGGTAQTRLGHITEAFLRVNRSMNGKCGPSDGNLETVQYGQSIDEAGNYGDASELYTGDVRVPISMKWERQKRIRVQHDEPTPFHLLGLITEIRVNG